MAKKKQDVIFSDVHCIDCAHCYDHYEMSVKGVLFMGRCPYREWAVFLFHDYCNHFKMKKA